MLIANVSNLKPNNRNQDTLVGIVISGGCIIVHDETLCSLKLAVTRFHYLHQNTSVIYMHIHIVLYSKLYTAICKFWRSIYITTPIIPLSYKYFVPLLLLFEKSAQSISRSLFYHLKG